MKKFLLLALLTIFIFRVDAQTIPKILHAYKFIAPPPGGVSQCSLSGRQTPNVAARDVPASFEFVVENIVKDGIVIAFSRWDYSTNPEAGTAAAIQSASNQAKNSAFRNSQSNDAQIYFLVPAAVFEATAKEIRPKVDYSIGTATTLVKIRPGSSTRNTEIGNDITIGGLLGFEFGQNDLRLYGLVGGSIGNVKLTSTNTNNKLTEDANEFAFTPTVGVVLDFKVAQLGLFSGIDILSGSGYKSWVYKGRPWIGMGIGVSIFKKESTNKNKNQD
jgi:hypothetical protein